MNGYSFGEREQQLLQRFAYRQPLTLTPQQLTEKWTGITRNEIAAVCQTDVSRVNRWLSRGRSYEPASPYYCQTLALSGLKQKSTPNKAQSSFISDEYVPILVQPLDKTERHCCPKRL